MSQPPPIPHRLQRLLWLLAWAGLVAGLWLPAALPGVLLFSGLHALFFWLRLRSFDNFSVQVRFAFLLWVAAGLLPAMRPVLLAPLVGIPANLLFGYCPLARLVWLLPWNRDEALSASLLCRVLLTPPLPGPFRPVPPTRDH